MQGRVYACRNSLQFCTIPLGLLAGGALIDGVCEPWMASLPPGSLPVLLFGTGKGAGAALLLFLLGLLEWRSAWCLGGCCESTPSGRSLDKRRFNCLFKHIIQTAERE